MIQSKRKYQVAAQGKFTHFLYRLPEFSPVDSPKSTMKNEVARVEDYFEVEYPVRTQFLSTNHPEEISIVTTGFDEIYTPFERDRFDFTSFISTPNKVSMYAKTFFEIPHSGSYNFSLKTCGAVVIWLNGEKQICFSPFTRNLGSEKHFSLSLQKGINEIVFYVEDLAERDMDFYLELTNENSVPIQGFIPLDLPLEEYIEAESLLMNCFFTKDYYSEGNVTIQFQQTRRTRAMELGIEINPNLSILKTEAQDGNITEFKSMKRFFTLQPEEEILSIGSVTKIKTAGLTRVTLEIMLSNGHTLKRTLNCSIYDASKLSNIITGTTLEERKQQALHYYSQLELEDINVALSKVVLNQAQNIDIFQEFASAFKLIEEKGDCADFILTPLLAIYTNYTQQFPSGFHDKFKTLVLDFRYWIDEPGNDVMWYFSENHALLFHVSQYLAGHLYPESVFRVSERLGKQQQVLAKERLETWFAKFFEVGFSEWNSTTYFPIDLIGFFSLYSAAPDKEIQELAKKALDYTFLLIAINYHGGTLSSTFGRVYEHNLKAMQLGEISSLLAIAWNQGYFNNSLRAASLFAISDYEPNEDLMNLLCSEPNQQLTASYVQGDNRACTYLYKTKDYSLASTQNYRVFERGHQQHLVNISLGDCTLLWINNPGEAEYSGGNRPSFWAGNDVMPQINQYANLAFLHYNLQATDYKFVHLYLPYWALDEIVMEGNWLFIRKQHSYAAIFFTNTYKRTYESAIFGREIRIEGEDQFILIKLSSFQEVGTFKQFIKKVNLGKVNYANGKLSFFDLDYGNFEFANHLLKDGEPIRYTDSYEIQYQKSRVGVNNNEKND